ncbi:amidohydrolase family protein [Paracoccus pantotrophus]|uniref:amidohydrolase family protein n=1 Tax=Paracoccus pantotrophus TaxID=82367 RepID=UPI0008DFA12E|nr:amidohydrolase family protein [Paracoccus pantotrophus]MDF3856506.1 amidohydrolase family protein [Paracoccus pantotrophus]SFP19258.1 cytosine deaminase [Paracoccus pantotrophus]
MNQMRSNRQTPPLLIRGGLIVPEDGLHGPADVLVGPDGRIAAIAARIDPPEGAQVIEARDCLVMPGLVDMHQHLDKTGVLRLAPNPSGTLQGARDAFAAYARQAPPGDVTARASRTLARCLSHGTTAIRSHVNVDKDAGFAGIEALAQLRGDWADRVRLQLVGFMTPHPGQDLDWLRANIDRAAGLSDAMGGTPAVAEDPDRYLDILFDAAARHGLPVDLHLDEHLDASRQLFPKVFDRVRRHGMQGRVVLSHCSVLSAMPHEDFLPIMEQILALDLGVVTLPAANLYLQGREAAMLPPRGLTRVAEMIRGGVAIASASDNIEDPFVPTGSGNLLEIARWTLLAGHLKGDELALAWRMIERIPARLMGLDDHGLRPGARADLLIARAPDIAALVAGGTEHLRVLSAGRLVSETALRQQFEPCPQ